jgi:putative ABC transport system permease protein
MIVGGYFIDAIKQMITVQYTMSNKEDITIVLTDDQTRYALSSIKGIDGIQMVEGGRTVAVKMRNGHREERTAIQGIPRQTRLRILLDTKLRPFQVRENGIILTKFLAQKLGVKRGDFVTVEMLQGKRYKKRVQVVQLVKEYLGMSGYMSLQQLNRLTGDGDVINEIKALVAPDKILTVYDKLNEMPRVMGVNSRKNTIRNFFKTLGETIFLFSTFMVLFAGTIALGVVYNSARILLSERSHELASLRVLGFTRFEVSYILLGEIGVITLAAIPIGLLFGYGLCHYFAASFQNELYRIPLIIETGTYARAAAFVVIASILSGFLVRRRLDHLDLVSVLKTKD